MKTPINDSKFSDIVKNSLSWAQVIRACGSNVSGGAYQHMKSRVNRLHLDVSHFLGKATHTGYRHTGITRRQHWTEILVERSTLDRDRSKKLRRAYAEYCVEFGIPIHCVDCQNTGEWRGKKLRIQVNHKDGKNYNNVPSNLEWLCPNCHDIKTTYK